MGVHLVMGDLAVGSREEYGLTRGVFLRTLPMGVMHSSVLCILFCAAKWVGQQP